MWWTTRSGEKIEICKLDDEHLTNIVNMLIRKDFVHSNIAMKCLAYSCSPSSGAMAAMLAENEFQYMKFSSVTDEIFEEQIRRSQ